MLRIQLLGPVRAAGDGGPIALRGLRQRTLLARLALSATGSVSQQDLIDSLWGGNDRVDKRTLQSHVSRLRAALAEGAPEVTLVRMGDGYALQTPPKTVDALWFESRLTAGIKALEDQDHDAASRLLASALGCWRGPALEDARATMALDQAALRLEDFRARAGVARLEAELALGRHRSAIVPLQRSISENPLHEPTWGLLLLALYRSGRQADALAAFRRARDLLREELGVAPGPDLEALHSAILRQDPALAPPAPASSAAPRHLGGLQVQKLEYMFRALDLDGDGLVTAQDFARHADRLGRLPGGSAETSAAVRQDIMGWWEAIQSLSQGGAPDGADLADWLAFWSWWLGHVGAEAAAGGGEFLARIKAAAEAVVDIIDRDGDGHITSGDYSAWVGAWGFEFDAEATFKRLDTDGDGLLSRQETVRLTKDFYLTNDPEAPGNFIYGPAF